MVVFVTDTLCNSDLNCLVLLGLEILRAIKCYTSILYISPSHVSMQPSYLPSSTFLPIIKRHMPTPT